jgi:hypothetical protein
MWAISPEWFQAIMVIVACELGVLIIPGFPSSVPTGRADLDSIRLRDAAPTSSDYLIREYPMGEAPEDALRVGFDPGRKLEFDDESY